MSLIEMVKHPKYDVNENKKRTLDTLTIDVLKATNEVAQLQAIVDSLTQKLGTFNGFLTEAGANKDQALSNVTQVKNVVKNAKNLSDNSEIALSEIKLAAAKTELVAQNTNSVINKLIYTSDMINKLANLIVRKKAQNPLISDQLIAMVTKAGTDANNAVALTQVALKATFAAQATNKETHAAAKLEHLQSEELWMNLTEDKDPKTKDLCISKLLDKAYSDSTIDLNNKQDAYNRTLDELNNKTADLNKAQVELKSLQSGLAAANAAALAS
jgi:hypothetical protein